VFCSLQRMCCVIRCEGQQLVGCVASCVRLCVHSSNVRLGSRGACHLRLTTGAASGCQQPFRPRLQHYPDVACLKQIAGRARCRSSFRAVLANSSWCAMCCRRCDLEEVHVVFSEPAHVVFWSKDAQGVVPRHTVCGLSKLHLPLVLGTTTRSQARERDTRCMACMLPLCAACVLP
jgi:hypothetical protein